LGQLWTISRWDKGGLLKGGTNVDYLVWNNVDKGGLFKGGTNVDKCKLFSVE